MNTVRALGRSSVKVQPLGFGGVPLGNLYAEVAEPDAAATVPAAIDSGIRYFDTAPLYGGRTFRTPPRTYLRALPRDAYVLSSKIGRTLFPRRRVLEADIFVSAPPFDHRFDFTYDGVMRQVEDSLQRLGTDRLDALVIHDLGLWHMKEQWVVDRHFNDLATGGMRALTDLRADSRVRAIGVGANEMTLCDRFIDLGEIDFVLLALRFTLLDQSGRAFLDRAHSAGVSVVVGAPFRSGILATGITANAHYNYGSPSPEVAKQARHIREICDRFSVPLKAAALQFPLQHPAVVSVLAGMGSMAEVRENVTAAAFPVPEALWNSLTID
jgi:D-threo-aldose 1-dehydrogenase